MPASAVVPAQHLRNRLLAALPRDTFAFLEPKLAVSRFASGQMLYEQGASVTHVVFPQDCTMSVLAVMEDGRSAEAGTIGPEGCFGVVSGVGDRRTFNRCVVQLPGSASLLPSDWFEDAMARFPALRDIHLRYLKAVLIRAQRFIACSSIHTVDLRCCRRLLTVHDQVPGDTFALTQDHLAQMLGVRRASVGQICARLQGAGIIRYSRGTMTILDRTRLEAAACECYGGARRIFEELLPNTYGP